MSMEESERIRVEHLISQVAGEAAEFAAELVEFAEALVLLRRARDTGSPVVIVPEKARALLAMIDVLRAEARDA